MPERTRAISSAANFSMSMSSPKTLTRTWAPCPLHELVVQYGDFASLQRKRLEDGEYDKELEYWKDTIGSDLPILELQTDRPRRGDRKYLGDMITVMLSRELSDRLKQLGTRNGCTLYMTLLAAFYVYLFRYTGSQDRMAPQKYRPSEQSRPRHNPSPGQRFQ
jgi:hypothetical protein